MCMHMKTTCACNDCPKQNLKYGVWLTRGHVHCHADATGVTLMNEGCVLNNNNTVQLSIEWFTYLGAENEANTTRIPQPYHAGPAHLARILCTS